MTGPVNSSAQQRIDAALELHRPRLSSMFVSGQACRVCRTYDRRAVEYPCPTVRALRGH